MGYHSHAAYRFGVSAAALMAAAGITVTVGGEYLAGETDAMGIDFTYHTDRSKQHYISDLTTPANNYNGDPYGKLTYTSPSIKMCRQADGVWRYNNHNISQQSELFNDSYWQKASVIITANDTIAPDGAVTAELCTGGGTGELILHASDVTVVIGVAYKMSVYIKKGNFDWCRLTAASDSGTANGVRTWFNLNSGTVGTTTLIGSFTSPVSSTIASAANGFYKLTVYFIPSTTTCRLTLKSASADASTTAADVGSGAGNLTTYHVWGAELKRYPVSESTGTTPTGYLATQLAARYDLPYEWDAALASQGILIEEQRTNVCLRSQDLTTTWANSGTTEASNSTTAPDGTTTADTLIENGASSRHTLYQALSISSAVTFSVFVKATGAGSTRYAHLVITDFAGSILRATYSLLSGGSVTATGAAGTASYTSSSITDAGNGWYRIVLSGSVPGSSYLNLELADSGTPTLTGDGEATYAGDSTSGLYYWGAQAEAGAFPTSPIHTIAATVTRAKDDISIAQSLLPMLATPTNSTLVVWGRYQGALDAALEPRMLELSDGTSADRVYIRKGSGNNIIFEITDGGAQQAQMGGAVIVVGADVKSALAWAANDAQGCYNGVLTLPDGTVTLPTVNTLRIGASPSVSIREWNGTIQQVTYLKRRASNSELQSKTT